MLCFSYIFAKKYYLLESYSYFTVKISNLFSTLIVKKIILKLAHLLLSELLFMLVSPLDLRLSDEDVIGFNLIKMSLMQFISTCLILNSSLRWSIWMPPKQSYNYRSRCNLNNVETAQVVMAPLLKTSFEKNTDLFTPTCSPFPRIKKSPPLKLALKTMDLWSPIFSMLEVLNL